MFKGATNRLLMRRSVAFALIGKFMGKINLANVKKTIYYLKRNGLKNTWYAVRERLDGGRTVPYSYVQISEKELEHQREWSKDKTILFSIVVPTYRTDEIYLREMIQSVAGQTYPHWELVLADATEDDSVKSVVDKITGDTDKIKYVKLAENAGIAANTNQALQYAHGDYIGLLDHDDVLTADALYEMAVRIEEGKKQGLELQLLYSDEDKCNGECTEFYELNRKEEFNLDLILSNNYICHFLVIKSGFIKGLGFRSAYDGAQDYDLVLRAVGEILYKDGKKLENEALIAHIPKVLYHWRCHTGSTAENPQSKQYAYDAGLRALQDFADSRGYRAKAVHLKHLGFYMLDYPEGIFESRPDLAVVGGRVIGRIKNEESDTRKDGPTAAIGNRMSGGTDGDRIVGGRMSLEGDVYYEGLPLHYSGYLNRAVLTQSAEAVDIRCMMVREECRSLFEQVVGVPYVEISCEETASDSLSASGGETSHTGLIFDAKALPEGTDYKKLSLKLCKAIKEAGYDILYHPSLLISRGGEQ